MGRSQAVGRNGVVVVENEKGWIVSDHAVEIVIGIITTLGVIAVAWINREVRHTKKIALETHKFVLLMAKRETRLRKRGQ